MKLLNLNIMLRNKNNIFSFQKKLVVMLLYCIKLSIYRCIHDANILYKCIMYHVSCINILMYPASCINVPYIFIKVSYILYYVFMYHNSLINVSCIVPHHSILYEFILYLVSCILYVVSYILYPVSCILL